MHFFLNEESLDGQFVSASDFEEALKRLNSILLRLLDLESTRRLFYAKSGLQKFAVQQSMFCHSLTLIRDKSVRTAFKVLVVNRFSARDWQLVEERLHSADTVYMEEEAHLVTDTSVAELAERSFSMIAKGALINFESARYRGKLSVSVVRDDADMTDLQCFEDMIGLEEFLTGSGIAYLTYSRRIGERPTTPQTILARDSKRFRRTKRWSKMNTPIFTEVSTGYHWYLDNFHTGGKPHFEVFDMSGNHLAEATWDGELIPGTADDTKHI